MEILFGRGENDLVSLHFRHQRFISPHVADSPNIIIAYRIARAKNRDLLYYGVCG